MTSKTQEFPPGWDRERVKRLIDFYENQDEEEAIAEDEAAYEHSGFTMMQIPIELVSEVQELLAKRSKS